MCVLTVDSEPLVEVFSFRECDSQSEVSTSQRGLSILLQMILLRPLRDVLLRLERLVLLTADDVT